MVSGYAIVFALVSVVVEWEPHSYDLQEIDGWAFNGTFSTNRLYHAFEKYVTVKKVKLMRNLTSYTLGMHTINHYNK